VDLASALAGAGAWLTRDTWDQPERISPEDRLAAEALIVDVDGFEGPLDLLLTLSRTQKVDLRKISVLQLAEQYLGFVEQARTLRIELAADYLVMAAWLAFLKSRLLLPPEPGDAGTVGRGPGRAPGVPAGTLAGDARCGGAADGARPAGARLLCPGPARRPDASPQGHLSRRRSWT
jgi:hypothetical protein